MCNYGNVTSTTRWRMCYYGNVTSMVDCVWLFLHLQQYSHRLNLLLFYYYFRSFAWQTLSTRFIRVDIHCTPNLHYHFRVSQGTHFPPCFLWQVLSSYSHDFYTSLRFWSLHFCALPVTLGRSIPQLRLVSQSASSFLTARHVGVWRQGLVKFLSSNSKLP
jgi:hypothetical protein